MMHVDCRLCDVTSTKTPRLSYPYGEMNFIAALAKRILIANSCTRWLGIFKGLSEDGGWADFSFFSKYMSVNLTSAGSISLDSTFKGQLREVRWFFYQCNITRSRESKESMQITNDETCLLFYLV